MAGIKLTLALEHYDRHLPLLQGQVQPEGIDLDVKHVSVEQGRHDRMLDQQAWGRALHLVKGELRIRVKVLVERHQGGPLTFLLRRGVLDDERREQREADCDLGRASLHATQWRFAGLGHCRPAHRGLESCETSQGSPPFTAELRHRVY